MKKHLIAAGLVAAFAAPAMAQNVSISGTIDTALLLTDADGAASTTTLKEGLLASPNLKFSGSEDLGGGLKAFFRLEQTIAVADGTQNAGFNRGSEVGISGSFGAVKIGKFDITGAEGVDGVGQFGNVSLNSLELGSDIAHSIQYQLPSMGGWTVQIAASLGDANTQGDMTSVYAAGKVGPAEVRLGYTTLDVAGGENSQTAAGVAIPVGPATVGLAYSKIDNATAADTTETTLSASMPIGSGLTAHAMMQNRSTTGAQDEDEYAVGVQKALSKRTSVYAAYQSITNKSDVETKYTALGLIHKF